MPRSRPDLLNEARIQSLARGAIREHLHTRILSSKSFSYSTFLIFKWNQEEKNGEKRVILSRKAPYENKHEKLLFTCGLSDMNFAQIRQSRPYSPYRKLESHREPAILTGWGANCWGQKRLRRS